MEPKAFIFDLDGVLTDTAHYHYLAWKELADGLGYHFDLQHNERLKGVSRVRSFEIILELNNALNQYTEEQKEAYANQKNERYVRLIQRITPADILPGVSAFLEAVRKKGIRLAVASASRNAGSVLHSLNIAEEFDYIADAAAIKHSKPDPEVFLDCSKALGLPPENCVGFEDAQAGIEAVHAAGMFAVGINVEVRTRRPDLILSSTTELKLDRILAAVKNT